MQVEQDTIYNEGRQQRSQSNLLRCYFAEINDLTTDINFEKRGSRKNCTCEQKASSISIISKGGSTFNLPFEQNLRKVFPLAEGLIVEFFLKQELKFNDILLMSKNIKNMGEDFYASANEKQYFSYVTLNKHPLNPLKILGILKKNDDTVYPWFRSTERIAFVSDKIPLLISYNTEAQRHAMYFVRTNLEENKRDTEEIHFDKNFYLLSGFNENTSVLNHSLIITEMFFEESNKENMLSDCKVIAGENCSEVLICCLIEDANCYIKIYSLNFFQQSYDNIYLNSVRTVSIINDVLCFFPINIISREIKKPVLFNLERKKKKKEIQQRTNNIESFFKQQKKLKTDLLVAHFNGVFSLYSHQYKVLTFRPALPAELSDYSFEITKVTNFKGNRGVIHLKDGKEFKIKLSPEIRNPLIGIILNTLSLVLDAQLYKRLFSDIVKNCLNISEFLLLEEHSSGFTNPTLSSQIADGSEFLNLTYFFIFILKLCNKNGLHEPHSDFGISSYEQPSKKLKSQESTPSGSRSAGGKNWQKLLASTHHAQTPLVDPFISNLFKKQGSPLEASMASKQSNVLRASNQIQEEKLQACLASLGGNKKSSLDQILDPLGGLGPVGPEPIAGAPRKEFVPDLESSRPISVPKLSINLDLFYQNRIKIFRTLHLLYQDMKLQNYYRAQLEDLAYFLFSYARFLDHDCSFVYCDYYLREFSTVLIRYQSDVQIKKIDEMLAHNKSTAGLVKSPAGVASPFLDNPSLGSMVIEKDPPDIFKWIQKVLMFDYSEKENKPVPIPKMPIVFRTTKRICRIFEMFILKGKKQENYCYSDLISSSISSMYKRSSFSTFSSSLTSNISRDMNKFEISYPMFHGDIFYSDASRKKKTKRAQIKELLSVPQSKEIQIFLYLVKTRITLNEIDNYPLGVGTPILEVLRICRQKLPNDICSNLPHLAFQLIQREDLYKNCRVYSKSQQPSGNQNQKSRNYLLKYNLSDTINNIIRGNERISDESYLYTSNISDLQKINNDLIFKEVQRLLDSTHDIKIKPKYVENITEDRLDAESQNILQKFCLRRLSVFTGQGAFNYGALQTLITEVLVIPKINLSAIFPPNEMKITLELKEEKEQNITLWPEFHNGVANGLKLSKHIMSINPNHLRTWIFYQRPESPKYEHGGFLLALGLSGYLDSFLPTDIYQYLKQSHDGTNVGILLGLAASRIGKMDEATSKTLCLHIPYLLPPNYDVEIPLIVQTAALIGIGLLHFASNNRLMTEMTLAQIGRKPISDKCVDRDCYSLAAGYALGLINIGKGSKNPNIKDLMLEERLIRFIEGGKIMEPPQSILSSNFNQENKCSSIREGNTVNTHITAPAALLALSLIFLKSNNHEIQSRVSIPHSFSTIESANPNHILLKIVTKNLIMWDSISNTTEFIYSQIPELIRFIYEKNLKDVYERYYFVYNVEEIDFNTVTLVYVNIIGGCIMAMGLKYAGTGNLKCVETIMKEIEKFRGMKVAKTDLANDPANKNAIDQYNLFGLLSVSMLSLGLIMAGSCDIQCLKVARIIRKKFQDAGNMHYGFNLALNTAIGFLFLGFGSYSFNRNDVSIAALLISIYPHFPNSPNDNKYHLQALRHFYVLAIEQRVFHAVNVGTGRAVNIQLEMQFLVDGEISTEVHQSPVLLQDSKKLLKVKVLDEDYYPSELSFQISDKPPKVIYIKKRYTKDIDLQNFKNLSIDVIRDKRVVEGPIYSEIKSIFNNDITFNFIKSLSKKDFELSKNDIDFLFPLSDKSGEGADKSYAFQQHFEKLNLIYPEVSNSLKDKYNSGYPLKIRSNLYEMFIDLVSQDRLEFLNLHLVLLQNFKNPSSLSSQLIQNILVIQKFYENRWIKKDVLEDLDSKLSYNLLNSSRINIIKRQIESLFDWNEMTKEAFFQSYFERPELSPTLYVNFNPTEWVKFDKLMKYCVLNNLPNKYEILLVKRFFSKVSLVSKSHISKSTQQKFPAEKTPATEILEKNVQNLCDMAMCMSFPLTSNSKLELMMKYFFSLAR